MSSFCDFGCIQVWNELFFRRQCTGVHSSKMPENRVFGLSNRVFGLSNRVFSLLNRVFGISIRIFSISSQDFAFLAVLMPGNGLLGWFSHWIVIYKGCLELKSPKIGPNSCKNRVFAFLKSSFWVKIEFLDFLANRVFAKLPKKKPALLYQFHRGKAGRLSSFNYHGYVDNLEPCGIGSEEECMDKVFTGDKWYYDTTYI